MFDACVHHDGMMTLWIRFHQFCLSHGPAALYQFTKRFYLCDDPTETKA